MTVLQPQPSSIENNLDAIPTRQLLHSAEQAYHAQQYSISFDLICECLVREPNNDFHKFRLHTYIREIEISQFQDKYKQALIASMNSKMLEKQMFFPGWFSLFWLDASLSPLWDLIDEENEETFFNLIDWNHIRPCLNDPFITLALQHITIADSDIETLITRLRKFSLINYSNKNDFFDDKDISFLCALAEYAFLGNYCLNVSDQEKTFIQTLTQSKDLDLFGLIILSSYQSIENFSALDLIDQTNNAVQSLIRLQITQPKTEKELSKELKTLIKIEDQTSHDVRNMYEENPYPQWRSADISPFLNPEVQGDMLVAGCGTGWHTTQIGIRFPNLNIQAIDLSFSSLGYAKRKTQEYGAWNIEFAQGDILELEQLNKKFDLIECSGVLHHMKDPAAGWQQLLNKLNTGGRMIIALYSHIGREEIHPARAFVKDNNYEATPDGIRAFRQDVFQLDGDHPVKTIQRRKDFYNLSECRDLAFHIQEKCYTLEELKDLMNTLGIGFLGFRLKFFTIERLYKEFFPDDKKMRNLDNWAKLEEQNPDIFTGMYQFMCCKKGEEDKPNACAEAFEKTDFMMMAGNNE